MKRLIVFLCLPFFSLACTTTSITQEPISEANNSSEITAKISGNAYITRNLQASIEFYTEYLNFREARRFVIESENGLAPFGLSADKKVQYVSMLPAEFSETKKYLVGIAFAEILDAASSPNEQNAKRQPIDGELFVAYSVTGLVEIEKLMQANNVPIVTPLILSATGKSRTLTVIDPNGTRVQMYEYVKK